MLHELRVDPKGRRLDWVGISDISPALKNAVIHSEDRRFFEHAGVDWKAVGAVAVQNLFAGTQRGASTITMQLAAILDERLKSKKSSKRTLSGKWDQMKAAKEIETSWTKDEIFEAYLNLIFFRGELQGLAAASRGLFDKEPAGLDETESLILASLIRSPNAPVDHVGKRACALADSVKSPSRCEDIKILAQKTLIGAYSLRQRISLAPHAAYLFLTPGIQKSDIVSTLDADLQRFAAETLRQHIMSYKKQNVNDGAVIVVENKTGDILAYVGGIGSESSARYVDGVRAERQAGSTLKPFLYAVAFERQILTPASIINDSPVDIPTARGIYKPENYENDFKGLVSARTALASSLNIPAVRTLSLIGVEPFIRKLGLLGFKHLRADDYYGLSIALGSVDVSLWELVNAYRTLANNGRWSELRLVFDRKNHAQKQVIKKEAALIISDILSDREARSATFGLENPLSTRFRSAVKTGTSKDMRDNWCIGYSEKYTVGVWVGNFTGASMWNVSGVTGAAPVWLEVMNFLHKDVAVMPWKPSDGLIFQKVKFDNNVEPDRTEWFIKGTEPEINEITLHNTAFHTPEITYPAKGTVIALDPDIPEGQQLVFFEAKTNSDSLIWVLNGRALGNTSGVISWKPEPGDYRISLIDLTNDIVDSVDFKVKGNR